MRRNLAIRRPHVGGLLMSGPLVLGLCCIGSALASEPDHSVLPAHLPSGLSAPTTVANADLPAPYLVDGFGVAVESTDLDKLRGGDVQNDIRNNGTVSDNHADNVTSGTNTLTGNAFADATGINTVIQNSGSNVLIQNAMIVNVQFADPGP
ncbi:MAG: hypothetical protein ACOH1P_00305 [Lysobacter sp.]